MSEGTPIEEVEYEDEGVPPLPNADFKFDNYSHLNVKNVVVYGTRILDTAEKKFKYRPTVGLFTNETGDPPRALFFHLHEIYDDAEVMARSVVMWANLVFGNVSKKVSIFDYINENERVAHFDITELVAMEKAVEELKEIHRTDIRKIH